LWFPSKKGLISGITIGGFGLGALVFDPISSALVNPEGIKPEDGKFPDSVNDNFISMYRTLLAIFALLVFIGIIGVFQAPIPEK
jgi:MFS transporter, OFA family, oxalate/formate antiporter